MTSLFDLTGERAIITDGGSGLGRQIAEALAGGGADLVPVRQRRGSEGRRDIPGVLRLRLRDWPAIVVDGGMSVS